MQEKVTVRCLVQGISVVVPYYFNNETVEEVDCYQILDTFVPLKAQLPPQVDVI